MLALRSFLFYRRRYQWFPAKNAVYLDNSSLERVLSSLNNIRYLEAFQ